MAINLDSIAIFVVGVLALGYLVYSVIRKKGSCSKCCKGTIIEQDL